MARMPAKTKKPVIKPAKEPEGPMDHEVDHWAKTLMDAEDIKNDPEKMKHVQPHLEKKANAIRSIADLKKKAEELCD
jgi:hypothetical protein